MKPAVRTTLALNAAIAASTAVSAAQVTDAVLFSNARIYNTAPHNAFTDLAYFNGHFYVTFREASRHTTPAVGSDGGDIRVLRSSDGASWSTAATFSLGIDNDLRDPKLSVSPDNRLILTGINQPHAAGTQRQSLAWSTTNGTSWSAGANLLAQGQWPWRVEWNPNDNKAYTIAYFNGTRIFSSTNGINFGTPTNLIPGNEAALVFSSVGPNKGTTYALIRQGSDTLNAKFGTSTAASNYTAWTFKDSTNFIGGPDLIELPDGRLIAGGRHAVTYNTDGTVATQRVSLFLLDPADGSLTEFLSFPTATNGSTTANGGDGGYTGLLWRDDKLYVSYYSSWQGKSSIYFATVAFAIPEPSNLALIAPALTLLLRRKRS